MSADMFISTRRHTNMRTLHAEDISVSGTTQCSTDTDDPYAPLPSRRTIEVVDNCMLTQNVYQLTLRDELIASTAEPAQFVNLYSPDPMCMLPRPFGVADVHGDTFTLIFAVVGKGTQAFAQLRANDTIDVLGPLGLSFDMSKKANYLLVSGGLGVPPLIRAAQALGEREDSHVTAVLGYRDVHFADEIMGKYVQDLQSISNDEGTVITLLNQLEADGKLPESSKDCPTIILSCGPMPMMKAVAQWAGKRNISCQLSLEARMGCGYGTCVACVVDTVHGRLKVCNDGPVFLAEDLGWNE